MSGLRYVPGVGVVWQSDVQQHIKATHDDFNAEVHVFRFYADGTESGSSPYGGAAENANVNVDVSSGDVQIQLRVGIQENGAGSASGATTDDWGVECTSSVAGLFTVTGATTRVKADTGSSLTDGSATTNRATNGISDGGGTFLAGEQEAANGVIEDWQLTANNFTEFVYAFTLVSADLANNETLDFAITYNGSDTVDITNSVTPRITITKTADTSDVDSLAANTHLGQFWMPQARIMMVPSGMRMMARETETSGDGNKRVTAITIDAAQVSDADAADLVNFPVRVTHSMLITNASEAIDADGSNSMQTDGGDVKFYSDAGLTNRLPCEIEQVSLNNDPNLSVFVAHVLVPTVDYNDNTTFYMTYKSTSGTESQPAVNAAYGRNAVWADYAAVLHLNTSGYVDSTGNGHTGSPTSAPSQVSTGCPWGGQWTEFTGTDPDYITLGSSSNLLDGTTFTAQCWAEENSGAALTHGMVSNDNNSQAEWFRLTTSAAVFDQINCGVNDGSGQALAQLAAGQQEDPRLCAVIYTGGVVYGHLNTSRVTGASTAGDDSMTNNGSIFIASYFTFATNWSFDGRIGQVRLLTSALTEGWLSTEFNMGNAPGTFATAAAPTSK